MTVNDVKLIRELREILEVGAIRLANEKDYRGSVKAA
jgi:DNA-binding GntR family transcriptional regulator